MNRTPLSDAEARRLYDQAALLAGIGAWECELATEQLSWTDGVYDLFGLPRGSTLHRPSAVDLYHDDSRAEMERLRAGMIRSGKGFVLDARITTAAGAERWMRLSADISHSHGRPVRIHGAKQDITREKQMWQGLRQLAYNDPLTGLANRRAFETQLSELRRHPAGGGAFGVLAIIDLDMFKPINDRLGHAAGDACLRQVALRLETTLSDALLIARIGGDEFALLLCSTAGWPCLRHRLGQALAALARPVAWNGRQIELSASIGATMLKPGRYLDPTQSFAEADSALYVAKAAGRNRLHIFGDPLQHCGLSETLSFAPPASVLLPV
ncbi:diguanylate cyclase [Bosea caraganae]|uniref:Diguanylate cyclase n=1 Tax=Bosea caraganae TaxID=2763117 RepID=A0A370LAT5_9HYPH|nr:diguanylate cyclase [Bosea caraganae]RDJ27067.1 diguanylate cyclase [Bosea caraganae]RDJ29084.1 diguanylate cyclase [Bosea caraganae]